MTAHESREDHRDRQRIASLVRQARLDAGLTLRQLASGCRTSHSTLAAYEQGRKRPAADVLLRILHTCGRDLVAVASPRLDPTTRAERGEELVKALRLAAQFPARHASTIEYPAFGRR